MDILEPKTLFPYISIRCAKRSFIAPPSDDQWHELIDFSKKITTLSDKLVRIAVCVSGAEAVFGGLKGFGMIKGARAFAALTFQEHSEVSESYKHMMLGYYGEQFVLKITSLNLASCWVGGTYNRAKVEQTALRSGEILECVVPFGVPKIGCGFFKKIFGCSKPPARKRKSLQEIVTNYEQLETCSAWIKTAAEAVRIAPSSFNKQPWELTILDQGIQIRCTSEASRSFLGLGIAMAHLEITAKANGVTGDWKESENQWVFLKS